MKFLFLILWLFKAKKKLIPPKKVQIIIYDGAGSDLLEKLLDRYVFSILWIRGEEINLCCLLYSILLRDFWRGKVIFAYSKAYIILSKPKLVITTVDNNAFFYLIKKECNVLTAFLQNGRRSDIDDIFNSIQKKDNFVDFMFVFNADIGKKYLEFIKGEIFQIGSYKNNMIERVSDKSGVPTLSYISQYRKRENKFFIKNEIHSITFYDFYSVEKKLLLLLKDWCIKNKFLLNIIGCSQNYSIDEEKYFDNFLDKNYNFIECKINSSYKACDNSNIVVFIDSTLGYESLARGNKTLAISCRNNDWGKSLKFGWPGFFQEEGPFWINYFDKNKIESKLNFIKNLSENEWNEKFSSIINDIMVYNKNNTILLSKLYNIFSQVKI